MNNLVQNTPRECEHDYARDRRGNHHDNPHTNAKCEAFSSVARLDCGSDARQKCNSFEIYGVAHDIRLRCRADDQKCV